MSDYGPWRAIDEATPRDGRLLLCHRAGWWGPRLLMWRVNPRYGVGYFGDPVDLDDYDELVVESPATHWLPIPPFGVEA